jgi:hypothetical protein
MTAPRPLACPIVIEFLGTPLNCQGEVTTRIAMTCDHDCERKPLRVCDFHARVIAEDDPTAICSVCDAAGRPESRVHLVSAAPLTDGEVQS